jgi:hypothetical protein
MVAEKQGSWGKHLLMITRGGRAKGSLSGDTCSAGF